MYIKTATTTCPNCGDLAKKDVLHLNKEEWAEWTRLESTKPQPPTDARLFWSRYFRISKYSLLLGAVGLWWIIGLLWVVPALIAVFCVTTCCVLIWRGKVEEHYKHADDKWRHQQYEFLRPLFYLNWDRSWDEVQPIDPN